MLSVRIFVLCASAFAGLAAMTATLAAKGQFDTGQMACKVVKVPTPAGRRATPYNRDLFDGNTQAWVPPVPPGYRGKIVMVLTEVCH